MPSKMAATPRRECPQKDKLESINGRIPAIQQAKLEGALQKSPPATNYKDSEACSLSDDSVKTFVSRVTTHSMRSRVSSSSRARRLKCYRCLDFEALPSKPLLQCQQCRKLWHPICCRPKIFNVKQYLGTSSKSTSYVCSGCDNVVRCEIDGCNETSMQESSNDQRLCKAHWRTFHRSAQTHEAGSRFISSSHQLDTKNVEFKIPRRRHKSKDKIPSKYTPRARKMSVEQSAYVESDRVEAGVVSNVYLSQSESTELKQSAGKTSTEYTHPKPFPKKRPSPSDFDDQPGPNPSAIPTSSHTKVQRVFEAAQQARSTTYKTPKETKISKQPPASSHPSHRTCGKPGGLAQALGALKTRIIQEDPNPTFIRVSSPLFDSKSQFVTLSKSKNTPIMPPQTTFPSSLLKKTDEKNNIQTIRISVNDNFNNIANGTNALQDLKNCSMVRQSETTSKEVLLKESWVNPFIITDYTWEPNSKANAVEVKRRLLAANWNSSALDAVLKKAQEEISITQPCKTKKQIWREAHMFHDLDPRLPSTDTRMSDEKLAEKKAIIAARPKRKDKGVFSVPFPDYVKAEARAEEKRKEEEAERKRYWWKYAEPEPESEEGDAEIIRKQKLFYQDQLEQLSD